MALFDWLPFVGRSGGGQALDEVADTAPPGAGGVARSGFVYGVPSGGTTEYEQGVTSTTVADRTAHLTNLYEAYLACPWSSACVDTIARTITAGGVEVAYESDEDDVDDEVPPAPPGVVKLRALLDYCNPNETIVQLMRGAIADLLVFGDAFLEVVWIGAEPVALFSLDVPSMRILADDHGNVTGYVQIMESGQRASFEPREVIHVSLDTPRSGLYGVSPTQKALLPLTTWLYTAATLKEVMRKGDPANLHIDFPSATAEEDIRTWRTQYQSRNIGARNIGTPVTTRGGSTVRELKVYAIENYLKTKDQARDEVLSTYGVPPAKVGVIESGNLGGGTGTSQDKTFSTNTCAPTGNAVMDALIFALLRVAFGVRDGWTMRFGQVDLRDDKTIDDIAHQRLTDGRWTINRARAEISEPPIGDDGDVPVIVDRTQVIAWPDIVGLSAANLDKAKAPPPVVAPPGAVPPDPKAKPGDPPAPDDDAAESFTTRFDEALAAVRREIRERANV